jgi:hypothetical protein
MSDPSDRFSEFLECGCSYEQGTWFYCARHFPGSALSPHSQHVTPAPGCDTCDSLLDEARALHAERPWDP